MDRIRLGTDYDLCILLEPQVEFIFTFSGVSTFRSRMRLEGSSPSSLSLKHHGAAVFHIGLAVLPWFWMGFAVPKVVIRAGHLQPDQVSCATKVTPSYIISDGILSNHPSCRWSTGTSSICTASQSSSM